MSERLHKFIAACGVCSRRAAERLIAEGRVMVNGQVVTRMGVKVEPGDQVRVDGRLLSRPRTLVVLLNKPAGVVTTMRDPRGRPTVVDLLPDLGVVLKPVGRLDVDTEGLLICTNDGELASRLAHPRYGIEKEYEATVRGVPSEKALDRLRKGVPLDGRLTAPARVELVRFDREGDRATLRIALHEGRNRQIRRMAEIVGHPVEALRRIRIGPFVLRKLAPGQARLLGRREVELLRRLVGLAPEERPAGLF